MVPLREVRFLDEFLLKMHRAEFRIVINCTSDPWRPLENDASSDRGSFDKTLCFIHKVVADPPDAID